ncbi:hypothetical protein Tco_1511852, partial [Tanacetum coccineum]
MESSSSNSKERELQHMQLEERQLHTKCVASFKELKSHLENLHKFYEVRNTRPFEIAFCILFCEEHQTFREKILVTEGTTLEANLSTNGTSLDATSVIEGNTLEACLVTEGVALEACLITEGATMEASLVTEGIALDDNLVAQQCTVDSTTLSEQQNECNSSRNDCSRSGNGNKSSNNESSSSRNDADTDIGPTYDSDTMSEVNHYMFENVFAHGLQNHEQPEFIPDKYTVNENNSNIIYDIPNMDPDRGKEEH